MIQEQALEVKNLAKPVVEALGVITERECPECEGSGFEKEYEPLHEIQRDMDRDKPIEKCDECNGTGKVGWKWEPKVGEWFLTETPKLELWLLEKNYWIEESGRITGFRKVIPILHWEEIERVLEGVGYKTELDESSTLYKEFVIWDERRKIPRDVDSYKFPNWHGRGKSRQQAVMLATIKLGEEKHD